MEKWAELPGSFATISAVSARSRGGRLYVFARGLDSHVYVNFQDEATRSWTGWNEVSGGGTTDAAVACEVGADDRLFLFAKGINDLKVYVNTGTIIWDGPTNGNESWTGWQEVPDGATTDAALSATTYGSKLHVFAKGLDDQRIYVNVMDLNGTWDSWKEVPGNRTTDAGLASAAGPDGKLHLFAKGIDDRRIYQNAMDASRTWSGWSEVPGGGTTDVALGVCRFGSRLYLLGKGINEHGTYLNMMEATGSWSGWSAIPGNATTLTSLSAAEGPTGLLYLFHVGPDQRVFAARKLRLSAAILEGETLNPPAP